MEQDGESYSVFLNSTEKGHVAVVARIDNTGSSPRVVNLNRVMSLREFVETIPGASLLLA